MADFFDLRATHNPHRWTLWLTPDVCVGRTGDMFMFGGVGLASAIAALERTTERPVVWATAQYLSYARPTDVVDLDVRVPVSGKYNSQARVISHVGDREILTVNAALGSRPSDLSQQWVERPDTPAPLDCPVAEHWRGAEAGLHSSLDNTLRVRRIVPTNWVLCDIRILGVHGGFGHGSMYLFAEDGELMASASQSVIVRVRESPDDR